MRFPSAAGVLLRNKCSATLQKVTMEGVDLALLALNATTTLIDCAITNSFVKAVQLKAGANLTATGCSLSRTGPSPGVGVFSGLVAHDRGTNAVLEGCKFLENNELSLIHISEPTRPY